MRPGRVFWVLIVTVVALLCHLPALFCGFVWDDESLVESHPLLESSAFIKDVFARDYGLEFGSRTPVGYYRPLLMVLNIALHQLFGPSPVVYHAFSLLLFCCSVVLFGFLLNDVLERKRPWLVLSCACLYAVHPAMTEKAVLFMSVPDMLMEIYTMAAILLLMRGLRANGEERRLGGLGIFCGICCLGMLAGFTKEAGFFILPSVGLTGLYLGLVDRSRFRVMAAAFCGLLTGLGLAYLMSLHAGIERAPFVDYLRVLFSNGSARALNSLVLYLRDVFVPGATVFLSFGSQTASWVSMWLLPIVLACCFGFLLWIAHRMRPAVSFLIAWFLAVAVNLMFIRAVQVPYSQRYIAIAPVIGLVAILADWLMVRWGRCLHRQRVWQRCAVVLVVGYLMLNAWLSCGSVMTCSDQKTFFAAMADANPKSSYPRIYLAHLHFEPHQQSRLSEKYAREAMSLDPDSAEVRRLGKLCAKMALDSGLPAKAMADLCWAEERLSDDAELLYLKAVTYASLGRFQDALHELDVAILLRPETQEFDELRRQIENDLALMPHEQG